MKTPLDQVCAYATEQAKVNKTVSIGFDALPTGTGTDFNDNTVVTADALALSKPVLPPDVVAYEGYPTQPATNQITIMVGKELSFGPFAINPSTQIDGFPCPITIQAGQDVDATVQFTDGSGTVLTLVNPDNSTGTPTPCNTTSTPTS